MNPGKIYASTPARKHIKNVFGGDKPPSDIGSPPLQNNMKKSKVLSEIVEAINDIGVPRKGASCQAIKKWMIANKGADPQRLKFPFKMALKRGVDDGILQRPQSSSTAVGATGFFMLVKQKQLKASKKTIKNPEIPLEQTKVLPKTHTATKDDGKRMAKVKPSDQGNKKVTKNSKISPKKEEGKSAKVPSKVKTKKVSPKKAPLKAKVGKKPAPKFNPQANAANEDEKLSEDDEDGSESQADEDPATPEVISAATRKGKLERGDALVFSESEEEEPASPKLITEAAAKRKPAKTRALKNDDFTESDKDANAEMISEAPKMKANSKAPAKNKTEKNNTTKTKTAKAEDGSSAKNKKGNDDKETKKQGNLNGVSSDQVNGTRKNAKKVGNKKLYEPENDTEGRDFSDTEINVKKKHLKMFKTFASDSEFEISKSEEKKPKRALRGRKNASKL